jgi:hypothetical protein
MTTKNSTLVSNFEASPKVMNAAHQLHGVKRIAQGSIALAIADVGASDIVMLAPIPSNASITSIKLASDDLDSGTTLTANVGLYTTAALSLTWMLTHLSSPISALLRPSLSSRSKHATSTSAARRCGKMQAQLPTRRTTTM